MVEITSKYLLKQTFWIYFFAYLAAPLGYLIRVLYARSFSVTEFGLIYSVYSFMAFASLFNDLGFSETLNYYVTKNYELKNYSKVKGALIFAMIMQIITVTIFSLIFYKINNYLAINYFKSSSAYGVFNGFILFFIFFNLSKPLMNFLMALHNYYVINLSEFLRNLFIFALSSILIFYSFSISYIGVAWAIGSAILLEYIFIIYYKYPEVISIKADLSFSYYKDLLKYSLTVFLGTGALLLLSRIDILMLTYMTSLESVGYYNAALSIAIIIGAIVSPFVSILFPLTSKLHSKNDLKSITTFLSIIYNMGLYLAMPFFIIFLAYPKELINLMYGNLYLPAMYSLMILSLSYFLSTFASVNFNVLSGLGRPSDKNKVLYLGAIFNIIDNYFLIIYFGYVGAAIATLFSTLIMVFFSYYFVNKYLNFKVSFSHILKIILLNLLLLVLIFLMKTNLNYSMYIESVIIFIVSLLFYFGLGYYFELVGFDAIIRAVRESK